MDWLYCLLCKCVLESNANSTGGMIYYLYKHHVEEHKIFRDKQPIWQKNRVKTAVCSTPFQHLQDMLCCKELDQLKSFELSGLVREWKFITGENWERLMLSLSPTTKLKQFKIQNLHFYSLFYVQFAVLKLQLEVLQANDYLRQQNFYF
ncbi:unnamed protein product [Didymodactylos carnosus]|uniref:Uncharacterized protein n=1 Tax=Didymodactylos carnosus TaxID=1234261 RepID=A0A814VEU8_9BILA|nr:unnamed protein product [Didymodactylos carnosus]CAF1184460.1 unnamed protein product [Didymodactylos carnosus]CAF3948723.1 unnamed protein product [Didymodactylos carnosus]CAF3993291.1 unnamed protein product [Didymodactylos carnosus]